MRFFIQSLTIIMLALFSAPVFSHAGSHENKNCFISLDNNTLRLSGYQFQGLHPDEAFCHIFPYLGSVIIKIEPVNASLVHQQAQLTVVSIFNSDHSRVFKKVPLQRFDNGVVMLQTDIQSRGLYLLNIHLEPGEAIKGVPFKRVPPKKFFFLVGIPVTKLLVLFSMGLLGILALFATVKNWRKKRFPV